MTPSALMTDEISCALGTIVLVAREGRLASLDYLECRDRMVSLLTTRYGALALAPMRDPFGFSRRLRAYLAGDLAAIDAIPVDTGGSEFQRQVWAALRFIPAGTTVSYADLARRIGHPTAVRAVGAANARNPVAIVVPCHRVIGSNASLTGYAGGLWRKRWLLWHERGYPGRVAPSPSLISSLD